jgi:hypothetical protein
MNSKKTLLSLINGGILGAPAGGSTVKFQFTTNLATAASSQTAGGLTFAADANGNAGIWAQGTLVSSAIQKVEAAAASGNKHGGKTITVTYIVANTGAVATSTFDVIDEAGLEAYFANSKTITLDTSTFEVKVKADGGLKVDNADGLYVDIEDLFGVDNETIGFDEDQKLKTLVKLAYAQSGLEGEPAIQLQNANDEALSEVTVADLIADGIVESTSYDPATNILTINWKGGAVTTINMAAIIDINDVFIAADSSNLLTATNDTSVVTLGTTAKLRNAVALAESAIQGIEEGSSTENYVSLEVAAGNDPSTYAISIDDSALNTKIVALDAKDAEIDSSIDALQAKDEEIDSSIDRLDVSVSAIEAAIEAMDATESDNVLDGSIAITVTEANGVITGVDLEATKSTVAYTAKVGETPANLTGTAGLLTGGDIATIKQYIDATQASGFDSLDSNIDIDSADGSLNFKVTEVDGLLTTGEISYTKSTVTFTGAQGETPSNLTGTEGFVTGGDIAAIKSYVDSVSARLDSSVSDKDAKEFVEVKTEMTDGALSAQEVNVTYGAFTVAPGSVTASTQGISDASAVAAAINGALTWTVLS